MKRIVVIFTALVVALPLFVSTPAQAAYACLTTSYTPHFTANNDSQIQGKGQLSCSGPVTNLRVNSYLSIYYAGVWEIIPGTQGSTSIAAGPGSITSLTVRLPCLTSHNWSYMTVTHSSWDIVGGGSVKGHRQDSPYSTLPCGGG